MKSSSSRDKQLRSFVTIAKAESLREAADVLSVTQAALSKQIRALEQAVGKQLFRRHGRGMQLTPEGHSLRLRVEPLLGSLDATYAEFEGCDGETLRISTVQTLAPTFVPELCRQLREGFVDAKLSVSCESSAGVVENIERGKADIGFVYEASVDIVSMVSEPVLSHRFALYTRDDGSPLPGSPEDIPDLAWILPPRQYAIRRLAERALRRNAQPGIECDSVELILSLLQSCGGATILPDDIAESLVESRGLRRTHLTELAPRRVVAIMRDTQLPSALMQAALSCAGGIAV